MIYLGFFFLLLLQKMLEELSLRGLCLWLLCQEIIKKLNSLNKPREFKVSDLWLLILMYMGGDPVPKSIEKIFKKKVVDGCIQEALLDQCISGNKEFVQVL